MVSFICMYRIFWGFGNTWHPSNMKRNGGIIADIDHISIQLHGSFICMYRIFWDFGNTWHTFVYST